MSQLPPALPGIDYRAEGRIAIDRLVRGTSLLQPGEEAQSWVPKNLARFEEAMAARGDDIPAHLAAFAEGYREAAAEAINDLHDYRCRLNGWK